jgi:hypothetical protein
LTIVIATSLGKETVKVISDYMYIIITGIFVMFAATIALRFRNTGSHGKAWMLFLGTAIAWFLAETTWAIYELVYEQNPFPSLADVFYVAGYPLFFGFLWYYLKPVRKAVTKKMAITSIIISSAIAIPSIYMSISFDPTTPILENVLSTIYPIEDAIIFVPSLIGIALFFRGEVNFTWSLVCTGIFCFTIGDLGFEYTEFTNTYYTGHPVDIILMWAYILFSFGILDHLRIFKKERTLNFKPKKDSGI